MGVVAELGPPRGPAGRGAACSPGRARARLLAGGPHSPSACERAGRPMPASGPGPRPPAIWPAHAPCLREGPGRAMPARQLEGPAGLSACSPGPPGVLPARGALGPWRSTARPAPGARKPSAARAAPSARRRYAGDKLAYPAGPPPPTGIQRPGQPRAGASGAAASNLAN